MKLGNARMCSSTLLGQTGIIREVLFIEIMDRTLFCAQIALKKLFSLNLKSLNQLEFGVVLNLVMEKETENRARQKGTGTWIYGACVLGQSSIRMLSYRCVSQCQRESCKDILGHTGTKDAL